MTANIHLLPRACTRALALMVMSTMVACAPMGPGAKDQGMRAETGDCARDLGPTGNTRLAAIQQLIDDNKPYAAIAELDSLGADTPKAIFLRADALRQIGQAADARAQYTRLLDTCLSGQARHGLGLLAAREGRLSDSLQDLKSARLALPTSPSIRNDYGYALLLSRRWNEAQFEFLTALDLQPNDPRASRNLVLLALVQAKPEAAKQLADKLKVDVATLERLSKQATAFLAQQQLGTDTPPEPAAPIPPLTASDVGR